MKLQSRFERTMKVGVVGIGDLLYTEFQNDGPVAYVCLCNLR